MKIVYLHIGTHRTGSTSIQRFLANAAAVLGHQGILYPETGRPDTKWSNRYGQHKLPKSAKGSGGLGSVQVWRNLRKEIDRYSGSRIIISLEEFEGCTRKEIQQILRCLSPNPVRVIVYLRPPMDLLRSKYKNRQKMGTYSNSFAQFVEEMIPHCNYLDLVSRWAQFDRVESVDICLFDKVKNNPGLEHSFAEAVGIDFKEVRAFSGSPANASPPVDLVQVARWINAAATLGEKSKMWQTLMNRARDNVLGHRWPGTWLAGAVQPLLRDSLPTDQASSMLREELRDAHEHFLRKYIDPDDRRYLPL